MKTLTSYLNKDSKDDDQINEAIMGRQGMVQMSENDKENCWNAAAAFDFIVNIE